MKDQKSSYYHRNDIDKTTLTSLGALFGGLVGSKTPRLASPFLDLKKFPKVAPIAATGIGTLLGAAGGRALVADSLGDEIAGELGVASGGVLGSLASVPFAKRMKAKPLGFGVGVGAGSVLGQLGASKLYEMLSDDGKKKLIAKYQELNNDGRER